MTHKHDDKEAVGGVHDEEARDTEDVVFEPLDSARGKDSDSLDDTRDREDGEVEGNFAAKIKKLRDQLKECQKERQEYLEMSQRLKADYVNLKRDEAKLREENRKYAKHDLLLELLEVADSFDMAMANKEAWEAVPANWRTGVEYIYSKLLTTLKQHDLEVISPLGQPFNPAEHYSVGVIEVDPMNPTSSDGLRGAGDNMVLEVVQKGYKLHDRVIRPAKVRVGHKI